MLSPMPTSSKSQTTVVIPEELKRKYGPLIELITASESMNDEERQYWINILPVMTIEQIGNLRQILQNEKDQLTAIDAKYAGEKGKQDSSTSIEEMEQKIRKRKAVREGSEGAAESEEKKQEEGILKAIDELEQ